MPSDDYTKDIQEEIARYAPANLYHHKRRWRLLFVSSDGHVKQSINYRRVVTFTLVLILLLSGALTATTGLWLRTRSLAAEAILQQGELRATLIRQSTDQELLMARLALAEEKSAIKPEEHPVPNSAPATADTPPVPKPFVRVDTLETHRAKDGTSLKISFKLLNDTKEGKRINGTLFLAFPPKEGSTQALRILPAVRVAQGIPSQPSRGKGFHMRNFSSMSFKLRTDPGELPHSKVIVYAFDKKGSLRYNNTFSL
ncbi:hypothetical protein [Desulfoluna sp.]|uniref:hypothetical protein n=1 Tax=Desulfoluna sp. TaxID=2045199 RepID=UPI002624292C|nr:hypothetical protein [Desulfoluna sp.]